MDSSKSISKSPQVSRNKILVAADLLTLAVLAGVGLTVWLYSPAREWATSSLAFGWVPIVLWAGSLGLALRFRPALAAQHWRWWGMGAAAAAAAIGILSFFRADFGLLFQVGYGGKWGAYLGGEPLLLGILKVAAIAVIAPLALFPKRAGVYYWLSLTKSWTYLAKAWAHFYRGAAWVGRVTRRSCSTALSGVRAVTGRSPKDGGQKSPASPEPEGKDYGYNGFQASWDDEPEAASTNGATPGAPGGRKQVSKWSLPSIEMLAPPEGREEAGAPLEAMAKLVERTLAEHNVNVDVKDIKAGPRIVRFGLAPGWTAKKGGSRGAAKDGKDGEGESSRVRVQNIIAREKDLALALSTPYLRIEPVSGDALVGIEVPSPTPSRVMLREVMESAPFTKAAKSGSLPIALGQDTSGEPVAMDLGTLPHLLIAGSTGSGKSVCINSVVASLLLTRPPDQLQLMMVDPKRVELTPFNGVPHLVTPVIVDADEVAEALQALIREMNRRFDAFQEIGVRNIAGYNAKSKERMPWFVLFVDELADLMMVGGFEVEQSLVRLAQLGRAAGIHLVLATQRPSVAVVTGLLKANIAPRVAFAVASQVDSRVILDTVGAEKLLGKGDMLLLNNDSPKPRRVQGTLVYDEEIEKLVEFWKNQEGPPLPEFKIHPEEDDEESEDGGLMDQARDLAMRNPHMSSSYLERRLKVGRSRAAQLIEELEDEGLVVSA